MLCPVDQILLTLVLLFQIPQSCLVSALILCMLNLSLINKETSEALRPLLEESIAQQFKMFIKDLRDESDDWLALRKMTT